MAGVEHGPHCETCTCGCTCGYGGQHVAENSRCSLNQADWPEVFKTPPGGVYIINDEEL